MNNDRPRVPSAVWIVLAAIAVWLLWAGAMRRLPVRPAEESPVLPDLEMRDAAGRVHSLRELRGRVVLLNLWASWCGPCRQEAPSLSRVQRDLEDQGVVVLGLNADRLPPGELARVGAQWGVEYTLVSATVPLDGTPFEGEGVVPHTWLIDRDGRMRASRAGVLPESSLRKALDKLLAETGGAGPSDAVADPAPDGTGHEGFATE